jgi:hypothetical protein
MLSSGQEEFPNAAEIQLSAQASAPIQVCALHTIFKYLTILFELRPVRQNERRGQRTSLRVQSNGHTKRHLVPLATHEDQEQSHHLAALPGLPGRVGVAWLTWTPSARMSSP